MTYFLVMGSLVLSVLFTLGWALSRLLRWVASGFTLARTGGAGKSRGAAAKRRGATQAGARRTAKAGSAKSSAANTKPKSARTKSESKPPSQPWGITRRLAEWHSSMALALVAALVYLVARLVEHGMSYRPPYSAPSGFDSLVAGLGWLSAALILLALLHRLAAWRCR
ncbi:hypothetical protein ACOJCM_15680 [Billgrantia sp. LNSP4103-1]|uniref:hypothetical protein n=1 Tax=Billgrantia sp. LNSP4103-1 TaxID=3410266 RepID=UPI00403F7611